MVNRYSVRVSWETGAEVPSWRRGNTPAAKLNGGVGELIEEFLG